MSEVIDIKAEEIKEPRKLEDIMKDYHEKCKLAGDLQYRIEMFKSHLMKCNEDLFSLNQEADALTKKQDKEDASA